MVRPDAGAPDRRDRPGRCRKRRPWIDWLHTARDQAALVRGFVKWDDQPASVAAAFESLMRASQIARDGAERPDVCLPRRFDAGRKARSDAAATGRVAVSAAARPPTLRRSSSTRAAECLAGARQPLILMGRVSRDVASWNARVALAETLNARVLTDLKVGAAFPTDHPLHAAPPSVFLDPAAAKMLREADVVMSLDWVDLAGTLKQAWGTDEVGSRVIQVSNDQMCTTR